VVENRSIRTFLITAFCSLAITFVGSRPGLAADTFKQSAELKGKTSKTSKDIDKYVTKASRQNKLTILF
jgi:hypothetical protein